MNRIYELQKKIETARHELDEALLQENRFVLLREKHQTGQADRRIS